MKQEKIGFIGLGNIGKPIADHISRGGFEMSVYDVAGTTELAPAGAFAANSVTGVAERSSVIFLCLPSLVAMEAVVAEIADANVPEGTVVVNTSTAGPTAAIAAHDRLGRNGIAYADATISASVIRARAGECIVMFSGEAGLLQRLKPVFDTFGNKHFDLGSEIGHGQRMKVINNCLIHTAFVITSEALAFGEKSGLDMKTMLDVLGATSGRNFATEHSFPRHVLTGTYDTEATIEISRKDIGLFVDEAKAEGCRHVVAEAVFNVFKTVEEATPGVDQSLIYPFTRDGGAASE